MTDQRRTIAVTGSSGFIGRRLVDRLQGCSALRLRLLSRREPSDDLHVRGDLLQPDSLAAFVVPGATVVHLAYLRSPSPSDNVRAAGNLVAACLRADVRRLILCSTADVVGASAADIIDETTQGRLENEYQRTKSAVEDVVRRAGDAGLEFTILRPTAVVGPGGANLCRLAGRILERRPVRDFALRSLQGRRRLNLVALDNVVAAIEFLVDADARVVGETYLISDDGDPVNEFAETERLLRERLLGTGKRLSRLPIPSVIVKAVLRAKGRPNWNVDRTFDDSKLLGVGFRKPASLRCAIDEFATWYRDGAAADRSGRVAA